MDISNFIFIDQSNYLSIYPIHIASRSDEWRAFMGSVPREIAFSRNYVPNCLALHAHAPAYPGTLRVF